MTSTLTCFDHNIAVRVRLKQKHVIKSPKINQIFCIYLQTEGREHVSLKFLSEKSSVAFIFSPYAIFFLSFTSF